jgi:hypothetical protein
MRTRATGILTVIIGAAATLSNSALAFTCTSTSHQCGGALNQQSGGVAMAGTSIDGAGIYGLGSDTGTGLVGTAEGSGGTGIFAIVDTGTWSSLQEYRPPAGEYGVFAQCNDSGDYAAYGLAPGNSAGYAVYGLATASGGTGVYGSGYGVGVLGYSNAGDGVYGVGQSTGYAGVTGTGRTGADAIYGNATSSGYGVYGKANNDAGHFSSTGSGHDGVWASGGNAGVYATGTSYGVNATCTGSPCYAGYFTGKVNITVCAKIESTTYGLGSCTSDRRLKTNIRTIGGSLPNILRLKPVTYEWIDPRRGEGVQTGFIAQDVENVWPDWVATGSDGYKKVNVDRLPTLLVDSVQALQQRNLALRARVLALEAAPGPPFRSGFGDESAGGLLILLAGGIVVRHRRRRGQAGAGPAF